jgi:hypothetical protein
MPLAALRYEALAMAAGISSKLGQGRWRRCLRREIQAFCFHDIATNN